ncbi:CGNR zinc finger domain-containing protein [Citricoccus sp. I39-566]|uniref:CGNR zinc finger domain-containing protein n=1 Tax=Citricoccus sp. I39-566 TaxID=3073268 RepID=UPI00286D67FB|nr:CGNR zinc finger domain-containing protein [Citricoccus sp. I39-566]WMY78680.1 CGNR zinc finger domain-containing protein [Citricoccus sp. I39-566]
MFSPITTSRLALAATLANTAPGFRGGRQLPDRLDGAAGLPSALPAILPGWGFEEDPSSATLRSVRKLRAAVAGVWQDAAAEDADAALEGLNALLGAAGPVRAVLPPGSTVRSPAILAAGHEGDAPDKAASTAFALALAEVALAGELTRLRTCSGEDCTNAFVDLTRNRSKQFCDEANCANRAHVKAYRARRAAEAATAGQEPAEQPAPKNGRAKDGKPGKKNGKPAKKKAKKK